MEWYYATGQQQQGPVSDEELARLVAAGTVKADTLVWHSGMGDWAPYGTLQQQVAGATATDGEAPQTGVCTSCGKLFPKQDLLAYQGASVCAACKPAFFQRVQEGASMPGIMEYGGFWIRAAAKIIDGLIMGAATWLIMLLLLVPVFAQPNADPTTFLTRQLTMQGIAICMQLAYTVFFLGRFGATPGKMACKLKVVRSNGDRITYGRACGRHFADMLSGMLLYIGYIIAAFDDEKRTLHDHICDTRVIKTE